MAKPRLFKGPTGDAQSTNVPAAGPLDRKRRMTLQLLRREAEEW